jgi:HAD superfamily hydrolase (TIGR01459 family)
MTAKLINGLGEVAPDFDAFLLDQFGVLHDGSAVYPGVVDCLAALKNAGKRVVILSNSGTLQAANRARLNRLGIAEDLYEDFASSGEVTRAILEEEPQELRAASAGPGPLRCLPLGGAAERALIEGLDIREAASVAEADFLLLASFGQNPPPRSAFDDIFGAALERGLTLVCANPDFRGVTRQGLILAPGALAADYQAAGGRVLFIGKPYQEIYRHVLKSLAPVPPARVLAVGDSLAHDIAGARAAGLASVLVLQGVHAEELGNPSEAGFGDRLAFLQERHGAVPNYLLQGLVW